MELSKHETGMNTDIIVNLVKMSEESFCTKSCMFLGLQYVTLKYTVFQQSGGILYKLL